MLKDQKIVLITAFIAVFCEYFDIGQKQILLSVESDDDEECDFIEYIRNAQVYHCLICNVLLKDSDNVIGRHINEVAHQTLSRGINYMPIK